VRCVVDCSGESGRRWRRKCRRAMGSLGFGEENIMCFPRGKKNKKKNMCLGAFKVSPFFTLQRTLWNVVTHA